VSKSRNIEQVAGRGIKVKKTFSKKPKTGEFVFFLIFIFLNARLKL